MRDIRGSVAIEFALVALPFFFLVANICEQGLIMVMDYSLQRGTENAARMIRVAPARMGGGSTAPSLTATELENAICEAAAVIPRCEQRLRLQVQNAPTFSLLNPAATGEMFEPGEVNSAVRVRVTYHWPLVFASFLGFLSNTVDGRSYRMTAVAVFRNEP